MRRAIKQNNCPRVFLHALHSFPSFLSFEASRLRIPDAWHSSIYLHSFYFTLLYSRVFYTILVAEYSRVGSVILRQSAKLIPPYNSFLCLILFIALSSLSFFAYVKRESPASLSSSSEADAEFDARCLADADVEQLLACPPPLATQHSDGLVNAVRAISVPTSSYTPAHSSATSSAALHSERSPLPLERAPKFALIESRSKKPSQVLPKSQSTSLHHHHQQREVREALTLSTELLELECCAASSLSSSSTDSQSSRGRGASSSASSGPRRKTKTKAYVCHVLRSERALREFAALFQQHWLRCRTSGAARARRERCKRLEERAHSTISTAGEAANTQCTKSFRGVLGTLVKSVFFLSVFYSAIC